MEGCRWQPRASNQSFRGVVAVSKGHLAPADSTASATVFSFHGFDATKALTPAASSLCRCQRHAAPLAAGARLPSCNHSLRVSPLFSPCFALSTLLHHHFFPLHASDSLLSRVPFVVPCIVLRHREAPNHRHSCNVWSCFTVTFVMCDSQTTGVIESLAGEPYEICWSCFSQG